MFVCKCETQRELVEKAQAAANIKVSRPSSPALIYYDFSKLFLYRGVSYCTVGWLG